MKTIVSVLTVIMLIAGCAKAPVTGRQQLILIDANQEMKLGLTESEKIRESSKLSGDKVMTARIERIGERIAAVAGRDKYDWQFFLIDEDDTVNAFALPGGHVYFYTGILKLMDNDDQIATVMGHEIAHVLARHGAERMSLQMVNNVGAQVLATALDVPVEQQGLYNSAYGLATNVGVMLPFSREHEFEADNIGIRLMAKAGYDPNEGVKFWQKMSQMGGKGQPEFLSTHPSDEKRIKSIKKIIAKLPKQ
jgi:metalloendopeptidase OMA1, mitochondrial